jgi:prophage antirepressor-like protein
MEIQSFENGILKCSVNCVIVDGNVWFRGKDVAKALGYKDTAQAVRDNVEEEDRQKLEELVTVSDTITGYHEKITVYINESGLYNLIMISQKAEAKQFKHWVTSEVLPSIRKTGSYSIPLVPQVKITNEFELHTRVVQFIRNYFDSPIIVPGLGEIQYTQKTRHESYLKGYTGGQPDILILNEHVDYRGFAIELKTPMNTGILRENQKHYLAELQSNGYKTLVSNDYEFILMELVKYFKGIRYSCEYCKNKRKFYSAESREKHYKYFHKIAF